MLVAKAELNYYSEEIHEEENIRRKAKTNRNKKRAAKQKNRYLVLIKLACLFIAIIILSTSLFILFRYANISQVRMEVTELERQKVELEKNKLNLLADLESLKSSTYISEEAINKLGMSYPKEGQVIYLALDQVTEEVESIGVAKKLNSVLSIFSGLF